MGCRVALLTMRRESIALMPCNPSIGGPAKGHLVREIDALGGQMGSAIDESFLQIRMLNTSKGAAVQAPRAQADKVAYQQAMRAALEAEPRIDLREATVTGLLVDHTREGVRSVRSVRGVRCAEGADLLARAVVLTTGTALRGRLVAGDRIVPGSRHGEPPALGLSEQLRELGFRLRRLKTGTPPRVHLGSIDFAGAALHNGSEEPLFFSGWSAERFRRGEWDGQPRFGDPASARAAWPNPAPIGWRPQLPCWLVHTNAGTHELIRQNLGRSPMFDGTIEGIGPRYCPSIEDKVVRFADKPAHGLFLEPEGWASDEVYIQGANTSLPEDVQLAMLRSIPQLRAAEVVRYGYAVEYDAVASDDVGPTLETRQLAGLYVAGQIVGTSGYEEAAAQGLLAGINAARGVGVGGWGLGVGPSPAAPPTESGQDQPCGPSPSPKPQHPTSAADPAAGVLRTAELGAVLRELENGEPVVLPRALAYAGVMLSDLTGQELAEPYRLLTARAEFRLLLRADTAELRLAPIGARLGLISGERLAAVERRRDEAAAALRRLAGMTIVPAWPERGDGSVNALEWLRRPDSSIEELVGRVEGLPADAETRTLVQTEARYAGYVARERAQAERRRRLDFLRLPAAAEAALAPGLRREAREQIERYRPRTIGEAARLVGVTPADVAALLIEVERRARARQPA
jgi:tRNA uridine 5-carboxymethylaminomethyl modification enzyme